jgi:hypothetical protein
MDDVAFFEARLAGLDDTACAALLFDLWLDAVTECGLDIEPRVRLKRTAEVLARHRFVETSESADWATVLKKQEPLARDGAPQAQATAGAHLSEAARRVLDSASRTSRSAIIVEHLVPALEVTDFSPDRGRAGRWLRRWRRRVSSSPPRVLWIDPSGRFTLRASWQSDGKARLVGSGKPEHFDSVLERRRLPPSPFLPVQRQLGGNTTSVLAPAGRPLREAFPGLVPARIVVEGVLQALEGALAIRQHLDPAFSMGPLVPELAWLIGESGLRFHHLGLATGLQADADCRTGALLTSQPPPHAGPEARDVFFAASFLATAAAGAHSVIAGFGPMLDEVPLEPHLPAVLADAVRRCVREPDAHLLFDALYEAQHALPRDDDLSSRLEALDEAIQRHGGAAVAQLLASGERDRDVLEAAFRTAAQATPERADPWLEARVEQMVARALETPLAEALRREVTEPAAAQRKRLTAAAKALRATDLAVRLDDGSVESLFDDVRYGDIPRPRGWVVASPDDVREVTHTAVLELSYGAMSGDPFEGLEVGGELCRALAAAGLPVRWSGFRSDRVEVPGFAWSSPRKRR